MEIRIENCTDKCPSMASFGQIQSRVGHPFILFMHTCVFNSIQNIHVHCSRRSACTCISNDTVQHVHVCAVGAIFIYDLSVCNGINGYTACVSQMIFKVLVCIAIGRLSRHPNSLSSKELGVWCGVV